MAYGLRVATINTKDQRKAIAGIYSQNPKLRETVEILHVGWARKFIQQGKRIMPLHIEIAEPEQTNLLIEQGLLYGSEIYNCEVYTGDCQAMQYFNCQTYKYTAKHCQEIVRCGFCTALGHKSNNCPKKDDSQAYWCAACKGNPKHTAWTKECPIRKAARQAYLARLTRFQIRPPVVQLGTPLITVTAATTRAPPSHIYINFIQGQIVETFIGNSTKDNKGETPHKRRRCRPLIVEVLR